MRVLQLCLSVLRTGTTYIALAVYILVTGPPTILLAVIFRWPDPLYWVGYVGVRLALRLAGIRYRVTGWEQVQPGRAAVYCANHTSNVEPPVLFALLSRLFPRMHILYKAEMRRIPVLGLAFELAGFVGIERGNRDQSVQAIDAAARMLREGGSFLIFPEGTRSRTNELLPFKKGSFIMALQAQVPIVPVAMRGGRAAMRRGSALVRPVTVNVSFGQPISTVGREYAHRDALIDETRAAIETMLGRDRRQESEVSSQ